MIYIVTPRYRLAEDKCYELRIRPTDKSKVRIITRAENCRGIQLTKDDEHYFLAVPEDWNRDSSAQLSNAWDYVVRTSKERNT